MTRLLIILFLSGSLHANAQNWFPASGNVGIGTTSPTADLDVSNTGKSTWLAINKPNGYEGGIRFNKANGVMFYFYSDNSDNDALKIQSTVLPGEGDATPRIHIPYTNKNLYFVQSGGSVAMGHAAPYDNSRLHIKAPTASPWGFVAEAFENRRLVGVGHDGAYGMISVSTLDGNGYSPLQLRTSNLARLTVAVDGKIGVGTAEPSSQFEVVGPSTGTGPTIRASGGGDIVLNSGGSLFLDGNYSYASGSYIRPSGGTNTQGFYTSGQQRMRINADGKIGIGTGSPDQLLTVNGKIHSQEIIVDLAVPAPDYVFDQTYKLPSLEEVKTFIDEHHHLPEVPSAKEMEKEGVKVGEMEMILLKKIEEMTLYIIELKNQNNTLEKRLTELENKSE